MADEKYRVFQSGLIPTLPPERIIGVRMPALRAYAREIAGSAAAAEFMRSQPHEYNDENCLHGLLINALRDYDGTVRELERFLPQVDNWAVCDLLKPRAFRSRPEGLAGFTSRCLESGHTYTVRFGIGVLMNFYLGDGFETSRLDAVARACCDEYYVNMMVAWYFATALAKREAETLPYIENRRLSPWAHNKTIQKAVESCRIRPELKAYLKSLRVGKNA